jgi:hypothetical protein
MERFLTGARLDEAELGQIREKLAGAAAVAEEIGAAIETSRTQFDDHIRSGFAALRAQLMAQLEEHAGTMAAPGSNQHGGSSVNVMPLRAALEHDFTQAFNGIHSQIAELAGAAEARISDLLHHANEASGIAVIYSPLPGLKLAPPLAALADPIALAAGGTIQAQWQRQQISPEERTARFRELIRMQFTTIIDKLCEAAIAEMARATSFILDHFRVSVLHYIDDGSRAAQATLDDYLSASSGGAEALDVYVEALTKQSEMLRAQAQECGRLTAKLAALVQ